MNWLVTIHVLTTLAVAVLILLRRHRTPESRAAWLLIVIALPYLGAILYILLGETDIGRKRLARLNRIEAALPPLSPAPAAEIPEGLNDVFALGRSISHFPAVGDNQGELLPEGIPAVDRMIADIDAARDHVHVLFYIWLDDDVGTRFA